MFFTEQHFVSSSSNGKVFLLSGRRLKGLIMVETEIVDFILPVKEEDSCSPCDAMTSLSYSWTC